MWNMSGLLWLKDKLAVGSVTNMYSIVGTQAKATKIINP